MINIPVKHRICVLILLTLLILIIPIPNIIAQEQDYSVLNALSPVMDHNSDNGFITVHQTSIIVEPDYPETTIPIRRLSDYPIPSLAPIRRNLESLLISVNRGILPENNDLPDLLDLVTTIEFARLEHFKVIRSRLRSAGCPSIAHNRLNTVEQNFTKKISQLKEKLLVLSDELDQYHRRPVLNREFWKKELGILLSLLGKSEQSPRIHGSETRMLPFGHDETPPQTLTINQSLPEGYEIPPLGYGAESTTQSRAAGLSYLEESPWNATTVDIIDLVHQLDDNPVKIYEYVLNTIETQFYAGAVKGAAQTLQQKSGNDFDQVSLLMAMFRVIDVPTRYIHGVVEVPASAMLNWTGLTDAGQVERFFSTAGIACQAVIEDTVIKSFLIDHVWLEAYLPYDEYRGVIEDQTGFIWVPLDPGVKLYTWQTGLDILEQMVFDPDTTLDQYLATHRPDTSPLDYIRQDVTGFLTQNNPGTTYESVLYRGTIYTENLGIFPLSTPFKIVSINEFYAYLPDELTTRIRFQATHQGVSLLDTSFPMVDLSSGRLVMSYQPATAEDQLIADTYLGMYNTPPYLIEVRGMLELNHTPKALFDVGLGMFEDYELSIELESPIGTQLITDTMAAGDFCALGIGMPGIGYSQDDPTVYIADRLYYGRAAAYLDELFTAETELAGLCRVKPIYAWPSIVVTGGVWNIDYEFGVPVGFDWQGMFIDVDLHSVTAITNDSDLTREQVFKNLAGSESSFLESSIFKTGFNIDSISTFTCFQLANDQSIAIFGINNTNSDTLIPQLTHPQHIIDAVSFAVSQGFTVTIPQSELSYLAWTGSGYLVEDPLTDLKGYFLSGDIAGGMTALSPEEIDDRINGAGKDPSSSGEPVTDPSKAEHIYKFPSSDFQIGTVGQNLDKPLKILVTDKDNRPVMGVMVYFETIGSSDGQCTPDSVPTNEQGIAETTYTLATETSFDPIFYKEDMNDEEPTQMGRNLIAAKIPENGLQINVTFYAIGKPDIPTQMIKLSGGTVGQPETPFMSGNDMIYEVKDQYDNPVANVDVHFHAPDLQDFTYLGPDPDDAPVALYPPLVVYLTYSELLQCGGELIYSSCGNQVQDVTVKTHPNGQAWAYPIMGDVGPVEYTFTVEATDQNSGFTQSDTLTYITCGSTISNHPPFYKFIALHKVQPVNSNGDIFAADRTGTTLDEPAELFVKILKEEWKECTGISDICGTGNFTLLGVEEDPDVTSTTVNFSVIGGGSINPTSVSSAPFQADLTLSPDPAPNYVYYNVDGTYQYPEWENGAVTYVEKTFHLDSSPYYLLNVWSMRGHITDAECLELNKDSFTSRTQTVFYELLPVDYPAENIFLDIYEDDSRLFYSGSTTGGSVDISRSSYFDRTKEYRAQIVINKGYRDVDLEFDREDDDPEVNEIKELRINRVTFIKIEDADKNVPIMPGKKAQALAITEPEDIDITWEISKEEPAKESQPLFVSIDEYEGIIYVEKHSGSGRITIRATDTETECFKEAVIDIGCPECSEHSCQVQPGNGNLDVSSVNIKLSLGKEKDGKSAGELIIKAKYPSPVLATPRALDFNSLVPEVEKSEGDDGLASVIPRKVKVRVVIIDEYSYEIRFFHKDSAIEDPYVVWKVENPDRSEYVYNNLKLTEMRNGDSNEYLYSFDEANNSWSLTKGGGLRVETHKEEQVGDDLIITKTVSGSGSTASKVEITKRQFTFGEKIVTNIVDPDGKALTTNYFYYDDQAGHLSLGKLKEQVNPDGSWVRYEYDNFGRKTKELKPWLDADVGADENSCRVIEYEYGLHPGEINLPSYFRKPRTETEKILGTVVSKTYHAYILNQSTYEITEILERCSNLGAGFGDASNLRTVKVYYEKGTELANSGAIKQVQYSDGRQDSYTYEYGTYTMSGAGQGSFSPGTGDFKRETIVHGTTSSPDGVAFKTTMEITITDDIGNVLINETYIYTDGGYDQIQWTAYEYDELGRETKVINSDGTYSESTWDCCGKISHVDFQGITTTYIYDALHRVETETRAGADDGGYPGQSDIVTTYTYDAEGRTLTTTTTGGGLTIATGRDYLIDGRTYQSVDQAGLITLYDYSIDGRTTTVTRPGGITEKTTRFRDGRTASIIGTGVVNRFYDYGLTVDGEPYTMEYLAYDNSLRWTRNIVDALGRTARTERPGFSADETTEHQYNNKGQLIRTISDGLADTLYEYDEIGNQFRSGLDVDESGILNVDSTDRITETETAYVYLDSAWWQRVIEKVYAENDNPEPTTTGIRKQRLSGLGNNGMIQETVYDDIHGNRTISRLFLERGSKKETSIVDYPDSNMNEMSVRVNGLTVSTKSKTNIELSYLYDGLGRRIGVVDPRTGTSETHYNNKGQIDYIEDTADNRTEYTYDLLTGQRLTETNADGKVTRFAYNDRGQLTHTWGDVPYPVEYVFDDYGQMTEMHTFREGTAWNDGSWPEPAPTADVTTWYFHEPSGLLSSKEDAQTHQTQYTYTTGGRLETRTWARSSGFLVTTYTYDPLTGELLTIDYSDTTPDISYTYDRLGRTATVTDAVGTRTFDYGSDLQLGQETITGLYNETITWNYSQFGFKGRPNGLELTQDYEVHYGYDSYGRFDEVSWTDTTGPHTATYDYLNQSDLLSNLTITGPASDIVTNYTYESNRNLKTQVQNKYGNDVISQYDYVYNPLGMRTSVLNSGLAFSAVNSAFNLYGYNDRNELTDSARYIGTNIEDTSQPVDPENRNYLYDPIGNRSESTDGTDPITSYQTNDLNQYTLVTKPSETLDITYDSDGNLTILTKNTTTTLYTYNAENRLISVAPQTPTTGDVKTEFLYDYLGRRVRKTTSTWDGSWTETSQKHFLYAGWNLIKESTTENSTTTTKYYVWGLDLSQTLQGAGGIAGLIATKTDTDTHIHTYDANGNTTQLIDPTTGTITAHYEYDPYGNTILETGPEASNNTFRFSTKYSDDETGLVYYGYRYYSPELGRWINRDPIGKNGGYNCYASVKNSPINFLDFLGKKIYSFTIKSSGESEVEKIVPDTWIHNLEEPWHFFGAGSRLGLLVGKGSEVKDTLIDKFCSLYGWCEPRRTQLALALWKWEMKIKWCGGTETENWPQFLHFISNFKVWKEFDSVSEILIDKPEERQDGIINTHRGVSEKFKNNDGTYSAYAFDAPRFSAPFNIPSIATYFFSADWRIVAEDPDSKWEAKIHINFSFHDSGRPNSEGCSFNIISEGRQIE